MTTKVSSMDQQLLSVRLENYQLKELIIKLENGKLDKPFQRKKS